MIFIEESRIVPSGIITKVALIDPSGDFFWKYLEGFIKEQRSESRSVIRYTVSIDPPLFGYPFDG